MAWNVNTSSREYRYKINHEGEYRVITPEDVINYARSKGWSEFRVLNESGRELQENDMADGYYGDITIIPVGKLG